MKILIKFMNNFVSLFQINDSLFVGSIYAQSTPNVLSSSTVSKSPEKLIILTWFHTLQF